MVRCSLAMALVLGIAVLGCVKDEGAGKDGSATSKADATIKEDAASSAADAMAAPPTTCREIRICIFNCREDAACAGRCVSSAPQAARALFNQAKSCSENACPTQEPDCRCIEECHGGGMCTEVVDECDEAISDPFCDGPCH
jgi:hypothetical protein